MGGLSRRSLSEWCSGARLPSTASRAQVVAVLEDDMQVRLHWLQFVLGAYMSYRDSEQIVAYALQRPQIDAMLGGRLHLQRYVGSTVVAQRLLGTWGFNVKMNVWESFVQWQTTASRTRYTPAVPGIVMTEWYKSFGRSSRATSMWEMWWLDFAYRNNLLTLFGNPGGKLAWGAKWMEAGEHYSGEEEATADSSPVSHVRPEQVQFPWQPVVLDWTATTMFVDVPSVDWTATPMFVDVPFGASPSLEQDSVRSAVCTAGCCGCRQAAGSSSCGHRSHLTCCSHLAGHTCIALRAA